MVDLGVIFNGTGAGGAGLLKLSTTAFVNGTSVCIGSELGESLAVHVEFSGATSYTIQIAAQRTLFGTYPITADPLFGAGLIASYGNWDGITVLSHSYASTDATVTAGKADSWINLTGARYTGYAFVQVKAVGGPLVAGDIVRIGGHSGGTRPGFI